MRIIFSLLFLVSLTANCFASTYIREYAYEPGEQIRKVQAREEAISGIKTEIISNLFSTAKNSFLSETIQPESKLTSEQMQDLFPLISLSKYNKERWDGSSYFVKAEFSVEEGEILNAFKKMDTKSFAKKAENIMEEKEKPKRDNEEKNEILAREFHNKKAESKTEIKIREKAKEHPVELDKSKKETATKNSMIAPNVKEPEKSLQTPETEPEDNSGLENENYQLLDQALDDHIAGNLKQAKKRYREIIKNNPSTEAYNNLGILLSRTGDFGDAIDLFLKAIELDPDHAESYNNLGNAYANNFETDKAIHWFKKAIKIDENYVDGYYNLARVYSDLGEYKKAEETYKEAIKIDENFCYSYYGLGNLYGRQKKFDTAIKWYEKTIEIDPECPDVYYKLGITYGLKGNFGKGMKYIDIADSLGYDENAPGIDSYQLAKVSKPSPKIKDDQDSVSKITLNKFEKQEESDSSPPPKKDIKKTDSEPDDSNKITKKVFEKPEKNKSESSETKKATSQSKKPEKLSPQSIPEIQTTKIVTSKTEPDTSEQKETKIISSYSDNASAEENNNFDKPLSTEDLYKEFDKLLETKQKEKEEANFVQETNEDEPPEELKGIVENVSGDTDENNEFSFLLNEQEKENEPEYTNLRDAIADFFQKGSREYMKGNFMKAIDFYGRVTELDPKNSSAYYSMGTTYARLQNYPPAIDNLKKAIKYDPSSAKAYNNLGFVYLKMAEYQQSIRYLKKAVELDSTLANAFCNLGDAYYELDEHKKKIEYYQKAARLGDKQAQKFLKNIGLTWEK